MVIAKRKAKTAKRSVAKKGATRKKIVTRKKAVARKKVVAKKVVSKRSTKKKVTKKKSTKKTISKKKRTRAKRQPLAVPVSPEAELLGARLAKSEEQLELMGIRHATETDRVKVARIRARLDHNARTRAAVVRARMELVKTTEGKRKVWIATRALRDQHAAQVKVDTAAARRDRAINEAVSAFSEKFLKAYDKKAAKPRRRRKKQDS